MMLEAISRPDAIPVELPLVPEEGLHRWDWSELVPVLMDPRRSAAERGSIFHASIAAAVSAFACQMRQRRGISTIALSGGVFQNNLLTSQILSRLEHRGIRVVIPEQVPLNDAGLSFGQIIEARAIEESDTFIRQGEGF
jgi:hydrogenase maturation protein HypF